MTTRAEVARRAGVSASTVTYALTGARSIKPETRDRILKIVAELNYVPHFAAGALAGGKTKTIAMLFPGNDTGISPVALQYITGATNAASARGYAMILWPSANVDPHEIAALAKSGLLGAVILMEIELEDSRINYLQDQGIPFAMIGRTRNPEKFNYVDRDFEKVSNTALTYFKELGHRKIAFLTQDIKTSVPIKGVDARFQSAILKYSKKLGLDAVEIRSQNDAYAGRLAYRYLRENHPDVTALLALPDLTTIGFLNGAHEEGISIPKDLSVISVNTPKSHINLSWPKLTTVDLPAYAMAMAAVNIALDKIEGKQVLNHQQLWAGDLIVGDSTAPLINNMVNKAN
jgi:DNA-binding LacI/PurR family transcriptional regulator